MHHLLFTMPISTKPLNNKASRPQSATTTAAAITTTTLCHHHHHSPTATLDLLILVLVLFSATFLIISYFSYIFHSLSFLLSHSSFSLVALSYISGFSAFFLFSVVAIDFCCGARSRRCGRVGCKGMKKAMEFDLQLQTEDCIRSAAGKEIDKLPWKGGSEGNSDYECLRAELRKMAPPNGRAVLIFRAKCGCPVAKLEGWEPKRGRRHKKALSNVAANGGADHR